MRFSLALISSAMLATLATAAPANPQENMNSELDVTPAQNVALQMGEEFQPFNWMSVDGEAKSVDRTFTLNLAEPAQLQITDYKLGGDSFEILDNGEVLGMTSEAASDMEAYAATPEEALQDERFSHALFDLAEGEHEITIKVANSPSADGTGAIRVVQKVQALYEKKGGKGGKGGKSKGKKGWDEDDDDDWEDDDDDWEDDDDEDWEDDKKGGWGDKKGGWDNDKKGGWDDDKKGGWDDDKKGGWGDKKGGWDDDKKGGWGDKKGGWDDDKKGGWGDKKYDWEDNKGGWGNKKNDWEDKKGGWGNKKNDWEDKKDWGYDDNKWDDGGWEHKKKTVYVYYTVPNNSAPATVTRTSYQQPITKTVTTTVTEEELETHIIPITTATTDAEGTSTDFATEVDVETDLYLLDLPFLSTRL